MRTLLFHDLFWRPAIRVWLMACLLNAGVLYAQDQTTNTTANQAFATKPERNAIGVSPVIAPSAASTMPVIKLNGVMSLFGEPQALFKVTDKASTGTSGGEKSYVLGEKQKQDNIEVVRIDLKTGLVMFNNHGVEQKMWLANASATGALARAEAPELAIPALNLPTHYPPEFIRARTPDYLGGGPTAGDGPIPNQTLEQRVIMLEANRAYLKSQHDPAADLLPPTAMTPTENSTSNPDQK